MWVYRGSFISMMDLIDYKKQARYLFWKRGQAGTNLCSCWTFCETAAAISPLEMTRAKRSDAGCWNDNGLMLVQRRRQWANIKPASGQRFVFAAWSDVFGETTNHKTGLAWPWWRLNRDLYATEPRFGSLRRVRETEEDMRRLNMRDVQTWPGSSLSIAKARLFVKIPVAFDCHLQKWQKLIVFPRMSLFLKV